MAIIIIYPAISCVFGTNHIMCSLINIHMPFFSGEFTRNLQFHIKTRHGYFSLVPYLRLAFLVCRICFSFVLHALAKF